MKRSIFFVLISLTLFSCGEEGTWINFKYDQARAYHFSNDKFGFEGYEEVLVNGRLNPTITNPDGTRLTWQQIELLGRTLNGNFNENQVLPHDCYIPHHGIVFFNDNTIVAEINICFICNQIRSKPANRLDDVMQLKPLFQELGFVID